MRHLHARAGRRGQGAPDTIENPTEAQIKEWMLGNLCRCTGYYKIVESIQAAAKAVEP